MADISIHQAHRLSHDDARIAAQKVADQLADEYDMELQWNGDVLSFKRSGVTGTLTVCEDEAQLEMTLGMMLSVFAATIEEHVAANMKKVFVGKA